MSVEVYTPDEWVELGNEDGQIATLSNGVLRWVPTWYPGRWDEEETRERFVEFLRSNPDLELPTDQGTISASRLLERYLDDDDGTADSYTEDDLRAQLRRFGRIP